MKLSLVALLLCSCVYCSAQNNYTGKYGYQESYKNLKERIPTVGHEETGYSAKLLLLRTDKNQYKFWLYVIKGYPNYNSGEISGDIIIKNKNALFTYNDSAIIGSSCQLKFQFQKKNVSVEQGKQDCGFGYGVLATDDYPKIKSSLITQDIADFGQQTRDKFFVSSAKAYLYQDEKGLNRKEQYFLLNDTVYAFDESKNMIFIEHISKTGKYVEGWINKKDLATSKKKKQ